VDVDEALGALRPYKGTDYRTSLHPDQGETLRQALLAHQLS
jgi:hypothetical protein